jgi:hypothetical protein
MCDLDDVSFKKAKNLAFLNMKHFRLKGLIILKSSPHHYHVVFDKPKRWSEVLKIISWMDIMANNVNV